MTPLWTTLESLKPLRIPNGIDFADLALEREPVTARLLVAAAPLAAMCRANDLDAADTLANEDLACWLIWEWYGAHVRVGGEPDPVAEQIIAEFVAEQASGIASLQNSGGRPH